MLQFTDQSPVSKPVTRQLRPWTRVMETGLKWKHRNAERKLTCWDCVRESRGSVETELADLLMSFHGRCSDCGTTSYHHQSSYNCSSPVCNACNISHIDQILYARLPLFCHIDSTIFTWLSVINDHSITGDARAVYTGVTWRPCTRPVYTGVRFPLPELTGVKKMHQSSRAVNSARELG